MTNNVIVIRSYSHREMIDITSLMFANNESDLIELQIRMSYTVRILKTHIVEIHHPNSEQPILGCYQRDRGFGFVLRSLRTLYRISNTSGSYIDIVNLIASPYRTSYLEGRENSKWL